MGYGFDGIKAAWPSTSLIFTPRMTFYSKRIRIGDYENWKGLLQSLGPESSPGWERVISEFFGPDGIEPLIFIANWRSLLREAVARFDPAGQDMSEFVSPSIASLCDIENRPREYARWFVAGYPDVVIWLNNLEPSDQREVFSGVALQSGFDGDNKLTLEALRALIDFYTESTGLRLECSR